MLPHLSAGVHKAQGLMGGWAVLVSRHMPIWGAECWAV